MKKTKTGSFLKKDRGSKQEENMVTNCWVTNRRDEVHTRQNSAEKTEMPVREKPTAGNNLKSGTQTVLVCGVKSPGKESVYQVSLYVHENKP